MAKQDIEDIIRYMVFIAILISPILVRIIGLSIMSGLIYKILFIAFLAIVGCFMVLLTIVNIILKKEGLK